VWALGIALLPPVFKANPRLGQVENDFAIQTRVAEPPVETFSFAILPGTARLDGQRADCLLPEPRPPELGQEFWTVIAPQPLWTPMLVEQATEDQTYPGLDKRPDLAAGYRGRWAALGR
jgi:hypothetical protein